MMTIETEIRPKLAECARVVRDAIDRDQRALDSGQRDIERDTYQCQQAQHWLYCLDWVLGGTRLPKEDLRSWVNRLSNG